MILLCPACLEDKPVEAFYSAPARKSGYSHSCRRCSAAYGKVYRAKNAERLASAKKAYALARPEVGERARAKYQAANPNKVAKSKKRWAENNPDKDKAARVAWTKANPKRVRAWHERKRREDPTYNLLCRLRSRTRKALGNKKTETTRALLGCSPQEFRHWIEGQFRDGMTWDNRASWELDHKKPFRAFKLTDPAQVAEACHYTNIQPLWRADNRRKGSRT